jgi:ferredoxin-NADP reductase
MQGEMITTVVTGKWQLAQGYHAVELQARQRMDMPAFDGGDIVDVARDATAGIVRSQPLMHDAARPNTLLLAVRSAPQAGREAACFSFEQGDEIRVGAPRSTAQLDARASRTLLFAAGVGVTAIAGIAARLAASGQRFEVHSFARSPERAVLRDHLDGLSHRARVQHRFGMSEEEIAHATSHAIGPTQADTQIICSGPPAFMDCIERQAREWVHASNVQKIVLGARSVAARG